MSRLDVLIRKFCFNGVEYKTFDEMVSYDSRRSIL